MSDKVIESDGVPIKAWVRGVGVEDAAKQQLVNVARLPIVFHHVAVMPDVHFGIGATVGSVVPTEGAIIPAAVGVDIGCGMMAVQTDLPAMDAVIAAAHRELPPFALGDHAVNCHHNYVAREHHFGSDVFVTRKGAVRAGLGELGIIPGSMGARSFIVRGKGDRESFCSCSHGAGRAMSRGEAKRRFTVEDHVRATEGIECRKDEDVIDETPMAYKPIDKVMAAQAELVEVVHELRQVVCVKG